MAESPLLEAVDGDGRVASASEFRRLVVRPNALGRDVLLGRKDYVTCGGVDRWVGGVHLSGPDTPWRFDPKAMQIVRI